MSTLSPPNLADFDLLVARSDGFIEADWKSEGVRVLLRKLEGEAEDAIKALWEIERQRSPSERLRGPGGLELLAVFTDEGVPHFVLSHFYGRALSVQLARGRKFSALEALTMVRAVGAGLQACGTAHGALLPSNVLLNDQNQARLVPVLRAAPRGSAAQAVQGDIRQAALLFGHILFGEAQAEASAERDALAKWTLRPEIPVRYRKLLRLMLSPDGPRYNGWKECLRDIDRLTVNRPRSVQPLRRSSSRTLAFSLLLAAAVGGGAWVWLRFGKGLFEPAPSAVHDSAKNDSQPADASGQLAQKPVESPTAPAPNSDSQDPKAIVEYTRVAGDAIKLAAARNYAGALDLLRQWAAAHPNDANREAVQGQIKRIELAQAALATLAQRSAELAGVPVDLGDKTPRTLVKIADGRATVIVTGQYGTVTSTLDLSTVSDATITGWLERLDAHGQARLAPAFLLGGKHFAEARALLKNGSADEDGLRAWADDWEKLSRDHKALTGLDQITALMQAGNSAEAQAELKRVRADYADSIIVRVGLAAEIYQWDQDLTAALAKKAPAPADAYPGLAKLTLSSATPVGDPDFKRLVATTKWAISHDGWRQQRDAVVQGVASAATLGNWTQYAGNLQRILSENTPSVMLSQAAFLRAVDPDVLGNLPKDQDTQDFLAWVFTTPRAVESLAETLRPEDKPVRVLEIWRDCWKEDRQNPEPTMALALAIAVDFDDPIEVTSKFYGVNNSSGASASEAPPTTVIDPVERYRFYRDAAKRGVLLTPLAELRPFELVWMVDAPVPSSELLWAENNVKLSRRDWGKAYGMIRYRMDKAAGGREIYDRYTFEEIKEKGGICIDQAYFASNTAKAVGIPAMIIGGEGDRGAHAWFGYEAGRNVWNLTTGRYADHYAAGTSRNPQTHLVVKEQELREFTDPERRTDAWAATERYLQLSDLLASAKMPEVSRVALDLAVTSTPNHLGAWNRRLDAMEAAKVGSEEWEREIAKMRVAFQKSPDILETINHRETSYLEASGDNKAALVATERQDEHLVRRDKDRTDLILDTVYKEAALAEKSGDATLAGRVYRDALREKGKEYVAFKALAPRYYQWAKGQNQGADAAHEIDQTFDRNFKAPTSDYFAMGAYHDALEVVIGLFKQEGLDSDVRRLERKAEKIEDRRKEIGDQSKRVERQ